MNWADELRQSADFRSNLPIGAVKLHIQKQLAQLRDFVSFITSTHVDHNRLLCDFLNDYCRALSHLIGYRIIHAFKRVKMEVASHVLLHDEG
jgi:hypothetical protein